MPIIYLIIHNVRSTHNVGSLLRSADGLAVNKVYLTGYTPYPSSKNDKRLPHEARKIHKQIEKTALGAEKTVAWSHIANVSALISKLKSNGFVIMGLEQTVGAIDLTQYESPASIAVIVGSERGGVPDDILKQCDVIAQIPMLGRKESFNVAVAGAIAAYQLRFGANI